MKIVTVLGARPQFIKAAPLSNVLRSCHEEILVHTGQHYDYQMSEVFFEQLKIAKPQYLLEVGSKGHGAQTGEMLAKTEEILLKEKPDWVLVYGDTNSTLAGALASAKLHIPVAHVEAGLRSFNKVMPEEVNRVMTDHLSTLLFCPSDQAVSNLDQEGITQGVVRTGDVMADALHYHLQKAAEYKTDRLTQGSYLLATIHRAENTDNPERLTDILVALGNIQGQIVCPIHPRTKNILQKLKLTVPNNVLIKEPVGYLEMIMLEKNAEIILTDSGGIQKEAYILKVPCITLREETEWVETVETGWNTLTGADPDKIDAAVRQYRQAYSGEGEAAELVRSSGGGIVVEPENPQALAQAIIEMRNNSQRAQMGQAGRKYVAENYSWKTIIKSWLEQLGH